MLLRGAYLERATGKTAFSVGKPSPVMMRAARKELGLATSETVVIGDTVETDILGGVQMGYRTILTLSEGAWREHPENFAFRPDLIVDSIADHVGPHTRSEGLLPPADPSGDTAAHWKNGGAARVKACAWGPPSLQSPERRHGSAHANSHF